MNCQSTRLWQAMILCLPLFGQVQAQEIASQREETNAPASFYPVDLSRFVTTVFSNAPAGNSWSFLPRGTQTLQGVQFKIDGKFEVTGMDYLRGNSENVPTRVTGIPVNRKADKIVLLHGTGWMEKDGTPMAKLVLHYLDGQMRSVRIAYGVHVRNWYEDRYEKKKSLADPNSAIAWSGSDDEDRNTPLRLYKTTFLNPLPGELIQSIDVVSLFSHATPIIIALTLQDGGPELKTVSAIATRRIIRKSLVEPDSVYTRTLNVRALASDSGAVLTNATLFATVADDQASYPFGAYQSDAEGTISFDYPPHQTVSLNLLVKSPNRAPLFLTPKRAENGNFPAEIAAKLELGKTIGGVINDDSGKPVAGARVLISSVTRPKPRAYTQLDYDQVRTDDLGHWQSSSLPQTFSNLVLYLNHPEYKPNVYQEPTTNALTTNGTVAVAKINFVAPEELLANKSVLVMRRGLTIQGTVRSGTNQPLANAEVYFYENLNVPKSKRLIRTKADGQFSFVATSEAGEAALAVVANGFAPAYEAFFLEAATNAFELSLASGSEVKARVMDNEQHPVTDATVQLEAWHNTQILTWKTQTDAEGRFVWASAPDGPMTFSISKSNYFNMRINLSASGGETMLTMRKTSKASGSVVDAETKKPIDDFTIIKGHSYSPGEPIRWNRYGYTLAKGKNGQYSVRLDDYYNGQSKLMIEAPGYLPVVSTAFTKPGWYTNDFELKKGQGFSGTIVFSNGQPVVNCSVVLIEPGSSASMDQTGEVRGNSSSRGTFVRTDLHGRFEFPPKAEVQTLIASHDKGYAEVQTDKLPADGKIKLGPWSQVKGTLKVGPKVEPGQMVVLQTMYHRYAQPALEMFVRTTPDSQGHFVFNKVPPGERMAGLLHELRTSRGSMSTVSHSVPMIVKGGETAEVLIGGTGRPIIGRVSVPGGSPGDVDWRRDQHTMTLRLPDNPENEPMVMPTTNSNEEREKLYQERNERMKAFWLSEKGRALQLKERSYVLSFETNGTFRAENIPAGTYDVYIRLTESTDDDNNNGNYRQIGSLSKQLTIPEGPTDSPFDTGTHEIQIRRQLKIGQIAPAFEAKALDGKAIKLEDYRGKFVLMDFGAQWSSSSMTEIQTLKSLYDSYGKDGRLVIIGLSVDYQEQTAQQTVKENGITWPECYLGQWSQTQVPARFGVEGIPHAILISPTGAIMAKNLQGAYLKTAVRNAIEPKNTAAVRKQLP